jgi:hypothetical protein
MKIKRRMTAEQEFEVLRLVLDKFLWLGTGVMAFGLYKVITDTTIGQGIAMILSGAVLLGLFLWIIVREYEFLK